MSSFGCAKRKHLRLGEEALDLLPSSSVCPNRQPSRISTKRHEIHTWHGLVTIQLFHHSRLGIRSG